MVDIASRVVIGMNVFIKRSNGQVHNAVVTAVNEGKRSLNVEWFEKGETKGKEVDFDIIARHNPTLVGNHQPLPSVARPSILDTTHYSSSAGVQEHPVFEAPSAQPRRLLRPSVSISGANSVAQTPTDPTPPQPAPTQHQQAAAVPQNAGPRPKSSCVTEIERLAQQRSDRRSMQAAIKKQRAESKIDPHDTNFKFYSMIKEYQDSLVIRTLKDTDPVIESRILVCVRKRPLSTTEINKKEFEVLTVPSKDQVIVHQPQTKVDLTKYIENQKFRFDYTFDDFVDNEMVYKFTTRPLVKTVFQGGFATCFAYGQTGSGKTHTMGGDGENGVYAYTAIDVFHYLRSPEYRNSNFEVKCTFFEIYGGKVFDLLSKRTPLRILEDGNRSVQIVGLSEMPVESPDDVLKLIKKGSLQRSSGATAANSNSSRSHAVFQIILKNGEHLHGKISLIDLAGNERGADTHCTDRQTRLEGAEINKSLLALKECIRAMSMNKGHVPFRMSKLTLVLRDSFVNANAKTCMIAMVSPSINSVENSLNTLRYADRVKELVADPDRVSDEDLGIVDEEEEDQSPAPSPPHIPPTIQNGRNANGNGGGDRPGLRDFKPPLPPHARPVERKPVANGKAPVTKPSKKTVTSHDYTFEAENLAGEFLDAENTAIENHVDVSSECLKIMNLMELPKNVDYDVDEYLARANICANNILHSVTKWRASLEVLAAKRDQEKRYLDTRK